VNLIQSSGGVFEVEVDGQLVFSKKKTGRHAQPGEIVKLLGRR
jgi:selenoprotein W-related protein